MDRADRLELIARLGVDRDYALRAALEEVVHMKREYEKNLGRTMLASTNPIDQREIDRKQGFFRGLAFAYAVLPKNAGPQLERLLVKELEERDSE